MLVRVYVGGAIPVISGLPLVGDIGLVIGVSLVVRPAQREMASCHFAPSACEFALKAKSCFVNPYAARNDGKHENSTAESLIPLKRLQIPFRRL